MEKKIHTVKRALKRQQYSLDLLHYSLQRLVSHENIPVFAASSPSVFSIPDVDTAVNAPGTVVGAGIVNTAQHCKARLKYSTCLTYVHACEARTREKNGQQ